MIKNKIIEAEKKYRELKYQLENKIISIEEFKRQHKALLIKDSIGRFWIIGDKSGKWYKNIEGKWVCDNPYNYVKQEVKKEIKREIVEVEDKKETNLDKKNKVETPYINNKERTETKLLLIKSIDVLSLAFLSLGISFFIGLLWGAAVGIFPNAYYPFISLLPRFIVETRSTITGGFIYSLLNAILFALFGYISGIFLAYFFNFFAYLVGGIKITFLSKSK